MTIFLTKFFKKLSFINFILVILFLANSISIYLKLTIDSPNCFLCNYQLALNIISFIFLLYSKFFSKFFSKYYSSFIALISVSCNIIMSFYHNLIFFNIIKSAPRCIIHSSSLAASKKSFSQLSTTVDSIYNTCSNTFQFLHIPFPTYNLILQLILLCYLITFFISYLKNYSKI